MQYWKRSVIRSTMQHWREWHLIIARYCLFLAMIEATVFLRLQRRIYICIISWLQLWNYHMMSKQVSHHYSSPLTLPISTVTFHLSILSQTLRYGLDLLCIQSYSLWIWELESLRPLISSFFLKNRVFFHTIDPTYSFTSHHSSQLLSQFPFVSTLPNLLLSLY